MYWILTALLFIFLPTSINSKPKNKTFKNIKILNNTLTNKLTVCDTAKIKGDLFVDGTIDSNNLGNIATVQGPVTINSVARWAETDPALKDSKVFIDDLGNIEINGISKKW